jgi:hypothetical protein
MSLLGMQPFEKHTPVKAIPETRENSMPNVKSTDTSNRQTTAKKLIPVVKQLRKIKTDPKIGNRIKYPTQGIFL